MMPTPTPWEGSEEVLDVDNIYNSHDYKVSPLHILEYDEVEQTFINFYYTFIHA